MAVGRSPQVGVVEVVPVIAPHETIQMAFHSATVRASIEVVIVV